MTLESHSVIKHGRLVLLMYFFEEKLLSIIYTVCLNNLQVLFFHGQLILCINRGQKYTPTPHYNALSRKKTNTQIKIDISIKTQYMISKIWEADSENLNFFHLS